MNCTTFKEGVECAFMTPQGCNFNGGSCHPIVDQCQGCARAKAFPAGTFCLSFPDPTIKWRRGSCNMASHLKKEVTAAAKVNPLKASKRAAR